MAAINTAITIRMNAPMTNFEPMALSCLPNRNRKEESRELPIARPASKASAVRGSYASPQVPSGLQYRGMFHIAVLGQGQCNSEREITALT